MKTKITITSDFICPWCYLGKARLFKAIEQSGKADAVEIEWQAFELNPTMPQQGMTRKEYRSRKFGWERSLAMDAQLTELGKEEGLAFDFPTISRTPNTRLAHRLTQFAKRFDRATAYANQVFFAYFEQGKDIGSEQVLMDILSQVGLDPALAKQFITSEEGLAEVLAQENAAHQKGVHGVPYTEIGTAAIPGAQAVEIFGEALEFAASEAAKPAPTAATQAADKNCL